MIGTSISHYRVLERLGSGGMGTVYLAEDTRLHRKVALKFLVEPNAGDPQARARLQREAEAASALDHPNVATIYEVGEADGRLFIAMAYYAGETLKDRLARGPLSIEEAAAIAEQVAEGLAAAHAAGIVHRDLKPANIILTSTGQVKILDFGLAKQVAEEAETRSALTGQGTTLGTIGYMFADADARSPFDRAPNFGFRCVRYDEGDATVAAASAPAVPPSRDYTREKPVSDDVFEAYKRLFSYDRTDLAASVDAVDDSDPSWRREKVSFAAAYGGERVIAYIYLPRGSKPPYQTVFIMPGAGAWDERSSEAMAASPFFAYLVKSGRAAVLPLYKGTYERGSDAFKQDVSKASSLWRDYTILFAKDLARTVDYAQTRPELDKERLAFLGLSRGGSLSPVMLANEKRIKTAILWIPGLYSEPVLPEVDAINFLPRMTIPALVLSGKYDYNFPDETSSRPFFELMGTSPDRKRRVVFDTGHNLPQNEAVKETLAWLDRELGVVR